MDAICLGVTACQTDWEVIVANHFDNRLCLQHFRMTRATLEMVHNDTGLLVIPVTLCCVFSVSKFNHMTILSKSTIIICVSLGNLPMTSVLLLTEMTETVEMYSLNVIPS